MACYLAPDHNMNSASPACRYHNATTNSCQITYTSTEGGAHGHLEQELATRGESLSYGGDAPSVYPTVNIDPKTVLSLIPKWAGALN